MRLDPKDVHQVQEARVQQEGWFWTPSSGSHKDVSYNCGAHSMPRDRGSLRCKEQIPEEKVDKQSNADIFIQLNKPELRKPESPVNTEEDFPCLVSQARVQRALHQILLCSKPQPPSLTAFLQKVLILLGNPQHSKNTSAVWQCHN